MGIQYEVTLKVKVDADFFYYNLDTIARQDIMSETILNALYDIDEISVSRVTAEEVEV